MVSRLSLGAKPILFALRAFSQKPVLPKYPVPQLSSTLEKYLKSVKPFLTPEEQIEVENSIKQFGAPGGEAETLNALLLQRASKMDNWLEEWWVNTAYLQYRDPVVVFSSPGLVFPKQTFKSDDDRLTCAAKMIAIALDYKHLIDCEKIPQEMFGKHPLDMSQYQKVFGTCRIPGSSCDSLSYHPRSEHVIVISNNHFYKVVVKDGIHWLKYNQIVESLKDIWSKTCESPGAPIGLLSTDHRDNWFSSYEELKKIPSNTENLKAIEESLFCLCLDAVDPYFCKNNMTTTGKQVVHGGGPKSNAANRWYDKTIQFVVSKDGGIGLTYEHSPAEGQPIAIMMDYIMKNLETAERGDENITSNYNELKFETNDAINDKLKIAEDNLTKLVDDLEFNCFSFDDFGKEELKGFQVSPDSFLQMAMQYAFYRIHKVPGAHYESGSTRMFIGGRTETIRSCSVESINFAKAMMDSSASDQSKANALRTAIQAHKDYALAALNAQGIDRHLLGLRMIAKDNKLPIPTLFNEKAYKESTHMRISTSQVASLCDGFMVYGPLVHNGYSCCYNPRKNNINFGTSSFVSCTETSAIKFEEALRNSLNDMRNVLLKAPQAKL